MPSICISNEASKAVFRSVSGLQESSAKSVNKVLNANELLNVVSILTEISKDPGVRERLAAMRAEGNLHVPSLSATIIPAHLAVHVHTAKDTMKER